MEDISPLEKGITPLKEGMKAARLLAMNIYFINIYSILIG